MSYFCDNSVIADNLIKGKFHPFVKWAGGKSRLLVHLDKQLPEKFSNYFEPFLGGGALFFYLNLIRCNNQNFISYLSDINKELINAYEIIKEKPNSLIHVLMKYENQYYKNPKKFYYELRGRCTKDKIEMAARFITLNKTCYNGLYRVNKKGIFNVPFGKYKKPKICDERNIINVSNLLKRTKTIVQAGDYEKILLQNVKENDFIYLDPPYNPIDETANFTEYTNTGFDNLEQKRLANLFNDLDQRGCKIILSNSYTNLVRELYKKFKIFKVDVLRSINSKPNRRTGYNELIIRNF